MKQEGWGTIIALDIIGLSFNRVLENDIPGPRQGERKVAWADKYHSCPGLGEIPELSFWVKVPFSLLFFYCSKPLYFLTKLCREEENSNDSTYVTQSYRALPFFLKDNPQESSIFSLSRFPFQPELAGMLLFPFLPFCVGASWDSSEGLLRCWVFWKDAALQ